MNKIPKILLFVLIFISVLIALYLTWENYQYRAIQKETAASKLYWSDAIDVAKEQNMTVDEFITKFGSKAEIINQEQNSVLLRQTIPLNNAVCSAWLFDISFSQSVSNSTGLSLVTESGTCL